MNEEKFYLQKTNYFPIKNKNSKNLIHENFLTKELIYWDGKLKTLTAVDWNEQCNLLKMIKQ